MVIRLLKRDDITQIQFLQKPEMCVPVPGDDTVPTFPGQGRASQMRWPEGKCPGTGIREYDLIHAETWHRETGDGSCIGPGPGLCIRDFTAVDPSGPGLFEKNLLKPCLSMDIDYPSSLPNPAASRCS